MFGNHIISSESGSIILALDSSVLIAGINKERPLPARARSTSLSPAEALAFHEEESSGSKFTD